MKSVEYYLGLNYRTSVYRDEEGDFIVKVPELPGCIADGKTPNEAFDNLRSAMHSWIESRMKAGLEIPEPRSTEDFSGRVLLRMPRYLHERLSQQAETEGVSLNQYMVSLLSEASARAQVQENQIGIGANIATISGLAGLAYQGFAHPGFINVSPNTVVLHAPNTTYVSYNCNYGMAEDWQQNWQQNLVVRSSFPRTCVAFENQKEPVLKPRIVPKQVA